MHKTLEEIIRAVKRDIESGCYAVNNDYAKSGVHKKSLSKAVADRGFFIIAEIKPKSPVVGTLLKCSVEEAAGKMKDGGAGAISVLTERSHFGGSLGNISRAKAASGLPVLMKDFIMTREQLEAGAAYGADAILLIYEIFESGFAELEMEDAIKEAHKIGLEVLLETNSQSGFEAACASKADFIGINNRDLRTLQTDIGNTGRILACAPKTGKPVISESGILGAADVDYVKKCGAAGALVGTLLMREMDIAGKLRELLCGET